MTDAPARPARPSRFAGLGRLALAGVVIGLSLDVASAAGIGLLPRNLQAGSAAVTTCGSLTGSSASYTTNAGGNVTAVVVSGIPAACVNGRLSANLVNSASTVVGSGGPSTVTGASVTIAVTPNPPASSVVRTDLIIVGP